VHVVVWLDLLDYLVKVNVSTNVIFVVGRDLHLANLLNSRLGLVESDSKTTRN
jgi:hypothetical protein